MFICLNPSFPSSKIQEISKVLLPIYRWRLINFWLSVEETPVQKAEDAIRSQAYLLRDKFKKLKRSYK